MKATAVHICIFTNQPPNASGGYAPELLPSSERNLYNAASTAAVEMFQQEGYEGTTLSMCHAGSQQFQNFISKVSENPPFAAIAGTFGDQQKYYLVKQPGQIKPYLRAMWSGEFGGTGIPGNLGEGTGGYGTGSNILCQILPPLCTLGFWPWMAIAAFTTYRTFEARSIVGRGVWGTTAVYAWKGFIDRGGLKQLGSMIGIGSLDLSDKKKLI